MDPRVRLAKATIAIEDEERQGILRVVSMLRQQRPAELTLHGHQLKGWLDPVPLDPTGPAAAEIAEAIEHHQASVILNCCPPGIHNPSP
jgi:hypothetical protein